MKGESEKEINAISDIEYSKTDQLNVTVELTDEEKEIVKVCLRKIDLRIVPLLCAIYILSLIDRSNIGAALVNGLRKELKLTTSQEGNATTIFYIMYIVFETPSNIILKKVRPHVWFGLIGSLWSISCIGMAFAKNGTTFVIARAFLGAFEAGFTPGVVGYLNYWYTRSEIGIRTTLFFLAVPVGGVVGGPVSAALASANTKHLHGYQMIFLVEGAITLALCIAAYFLIIDYPDEAKFLTPEQRKLIVRRLNVEQGMASKVKGSPKELLAVVMDWKVYVFSFIFLGLNNLAIILGVFGAVLISGMGFSGVKSTYIASIQSAGGLFGVILLAFLLNKVAYWKLILGYGAIAVIGYSVLVFSKITALRLTFYVIAGFGSVPLIPLSLSWSSVNQGGVYKGLIASAIVISIGTICGATVPRLFVAKYAPDYVTGSIVTLAGTGMSVALSVFLGLYFKYENRRRDQNPVDISHMSEDEQRLLTNSHPNFRFRE
ncbi:putative tartrate transporter [Smittium mucronatum]|uniref:Putative tartrate transporter n=1 Tax=Smittium mucronatum TaxID=133383 RepID=A0A1R0H2R3_9FUNG|nr:putative tartrate transporter [Smittium mucronatum]